jgi:2-oxoglutarate dehydrogenase E2 component (dihydrolipoamide succinyltransferase)
MTVDVFMPKMGESITEGRILKWLKQPGEAVDLDETILEISTDKVDTEVPAPAAGVIAQLLAAEGDTVDVGALIAMIETDASAAITPAAAPAKAAPDTAAVPVASSPPMAAPMAVAAPHPAMPAASSDGARRFYSPVVMRIAAVEGVSMVELERIPGTGANGRVTKQDIAAYIENRAVTPAPAAPAEAPTVLAPAAPMHTPVALDGAERVPLDNMRRLMAEHMVRSKQVSPHVTVVSEADITAIATFRARHADTFKAREGFTLTFMPFIADAVVRALKDFPWVNSSVDGNTLLVKRAINLGIAVAMDEGGLIVPVVKHAEALNLTGLGRAIADLAGRARTRRLQPEEIQDGTFTITNFGVFGNVMGTPIINQPQVAILGMGALQKKPVVVQHDGEDAIAIRSTMYLSLSFDHRVVDGALGGRFLQRVVHYLEQFDLARV